MAAGLQQAMRLRSSCRSALCSWRSLPVPKPLAGARWPATSPHRHRAGPVLPQASNSGAGSSEEASSSEGSGSSGGGSAAPDDASSSGAAGGNTISLAETRALVETSMLAAVSGLAYVLSVLLKLENSLGYILPLPIVLASLRSGIASGWGTMMATGFLLVVLLGPVRALNYVLNHGMLACVLGTLWAVKASWWLSIPLGALVRIAAQMAYVSLSSFIMAENLFALMLNNATSLLDQISAAVGSSGAPSMLAVVCMIFGILLVNGLCYVFLIHVIYRVMLGSMGYQLGPLPALVKKYLMAGVPDELAGGAAAGREPPPAAGSSRR